MLEEVDSIELSEWQLFYEIEPSVGDRLEWMLGQVAATIANANRDPKKRRDAYRAEDFLPKREFKNIEDPGRIQEDAPTQTVEQMVGIAEMLHGYFSGTQKPEG